MGNGAGKGDGWGGPAKGASVAEDRLLPSYWAGGTTSAAGDAKRARDAARSEAAQDKLYELTMGAKREETQLSAAVALLNRIDGMPIARNLNANVDDLAALSDDALRAERERLDRAMREVSAGGVAPTLPDGPDGVVH